MPRYLIHVGPHKTGTTYLQHGFTALRPELAARGVIYPGTWGGPHGHHTLAKALADSGDASLPAAFEAFDHPGVDMVLLSSETFAYSTAADLHRLRALLAGAPVTVIFYCRRWSELIPSCWQELVKHGSLATMPEFALTCMGDPAASEVINYEHVLRRFTAAFGKDALRIVSYNSVIEAGDDLLSHFCRHFLGWSDPPQTGYDRVNVSLDMVDCEVMRAVNALEWTRAREGRRPLYSRFMEAKAALPVRSLVEQAMQYTVDSIHIDDASPALARLHATLFGRYKSALVPPFPVSGLFEPGNAKVSYIRSDYLFAEGAMEILRGIHATLSRQR